MTSIRNEEKLPTSRSGRAKAIANGAAYGQGGWWRVPPGEYNSTSSICYEYYVGKKKKLAPLSRRADLGVVTDKDSQNTAFAHTQESKESRPLVMNAANARVIGGAFEDNRGTQEESLFYTTDLYKHLYGHFGEKGTVGKQLHANRWYYYTPLLHKVGQQKGANALHTRGVWCFGRAASVQGTIDHQYIDCQPFRFDVFTVAGFDLRYFGDHGSERYLFEAPEGFDWPLFTAAMQMKYELFFEAAIANGNKSVVAAALGCGAFAHSDHRQRTYEAVATAYANAVKKYADRFKRIDIVALNSSLATSFQKKLDAIQWDSGVEAEPAFTALLQGQPFFRDDITAVETVYTRLVKLTDNYLNSHKSCFRTPHDDDLRSEKDVLFLELQKILKAAVISEDKASSNKQSSELLSLQKKLNAIYTVKECLYNKQKDDEERQSNIHSYHRTHQLIRYLYNLCLMITIIPAFIRSCASYSNYGTFQFWQPNSMKALDSIENQMKKLPAPWSEVDNRPDRPPFIVLLGKGSFSS